MLLKDMQDSECLNFIPGISYIEKKVNLKKAVMMEKYNIPGICKKREKIAWESSRSIERSAYLVVSHN